MKTPLLYRALRLLRGQVRPFLAMGALVFTVAPAQAKSTDPDLWSLMRTHFSLVTHTENRRLAQPEVKALLRHKNYVNRLLRNAQPYLYYIYQSTQRHKMPAEMALIPAVESNFSPYASSNKGAVGLWQIMPGTASGMGIPMTWWFDGRRDLGYATEGALTYFQQLHAQFGAWTLAMAAYNAGPGPIYRALRHNQHTRAFDQLHLPHATHVYVPKLLALAMIIQNPKHYGVTLPSMPNEPALIPVQLHHAYSLTQLAHMAQVPMKNFQRANAGYRRWSTPPQSKDYRIWIPASHAARLYAAMQAHERKLKEAANPDHWVHHTVVSGDTLSALALHYRTSLESIRLANSLKSSMLHPGQSLLIPPKKTQATLQHAPLPNRITEDRRAGPTHVNYQVSWGDNLSRIAKRFNVSVEAVRYWNHLSPQHKLHHGDRLQLWVKPSAVRQNTQLRYRIQPGDTLSGIALHFHTSVKKLKRHNHLTSNALVSGHELVIPVQAHWVKS